MNIRFLISTLILLGITSACTGAGTPVNTETDLPAPAYTATITHPTATVTASPTAISSTETPLSSLPQMINGNNVDDLTAAFPLLLIGYAQRILWPSGLPENFPPADLLVQNENGLYPVLVDPPTLGQPVPVPFTGSDLIVMDIAPDASVLAVKEPGRLGLYTLDGQQTATIDEPDPYGSDFSDDGKFIVVTSPEIWQATVYETATGKKINTLTGFETAAPVYSVIVAPGGKTIAWIARATLEFQDVASGQMGKRFGFEDFIGATAYSPDGKLLALSAAGRLEVVSVPGGEQAAKIELSQPLRSLAFSPDGSLLAGAYGATVQVWDTTTWTPLATLAGDETNPVWLGLVSFSPDGRYLVSTDENNLLRIWTVP